jgi:putative ABC transport system ATP-binding protein
MEKNAVNAGEVLVRLESVTKVYKVGNQEIRALDGVTMTINKGDLITIQGPSGCGKSTLLNMIGLMDNPTGGKIFINEKDILSLKEREKNKIRSHIGFVFQFYNLLVELDAKQNVMLPLYVKPAKKGKEMNKMALERSESMLSETGLGDRTGNTPDELSGGERQRVAITRAIINDPSIILADEPTGNLDTKKSKEILELFINLNKKGHTVLIVTDGKILDGTGEAGD